MKEHLTLLWLLLLLLFSPLQCQQQTRVSSPPPPPYAFHQGRRSLKEGNYENALKFFHDAQVASPKFAGSYIGEGMVRIRMGLTREAANAFQQAVVVDSTDASAWHNAATAYTDLGESKKATLCYQKSVAIKMSKQVNGIQCGENNLLVHSSTWTLAMRYDSQTKTALAVPSNVGVGDNALISFVTPFLITLDNVTIIDTLMIESNKCIIHLGRHGWLRTTPRGLHRALASLSTSSSSSSHPSHHHPHTIQFHEIPVFSLLQSTSSTNMYHWMAESVVRLVLWQHYRRQRVNKKIILLVPSSRLVNATLELLGILQDHDITIHHHQSGNVYDIRILEWVDWEAQEGEKEEHEQQEGSKAGDNDKVHEDEVEQEETSSTLVNGSQRNQGVNIVAWPPMPSRPRPPTHIYYAPYSGLRMVRKTILQASLMNMNQHAKMVSSSRYQYDPSSLLWVSRKNAKTRHILNEKIIWDRQQKKHATIVVVHDGTSTLAKQLQLFHEAGIIVGPHGAGMTLIMFARHTTPVLMFPLVSELVHNDGYYHHIAASNGKMTLQTPSMLSMERNKNMTLNKTQVDVVMGFLQKHVDTFTCTGV
jgi:tetratricopeptide (TPR) repeat protein